ncbi:MAG: hypothetical protein ACREQF_07565 [Candidatus Binataceae bacterium]
MDSGAHVLPTPLKRRYSRETDALTLREVDSLVSKLLTEMKVPFPSLGKRVINHLGDLKKILSSDYMELEAFPEKSLLKELSRIVEEEIKGKMSKVESELKGTPRPWTSLENDALLDHLSHIFGPREIELRAEPYRKGAGLALRGFFCRANVGDKLKFVIFVNTAHHPGAVAATLGHEIGHFIYGSLVGETKPMTAFMEGTFSQHLSEEDELFADSFVALSAYSPELIKTIGPLSNVSQGGTDEIFTRIRKAYELIAPRFQLDLKGGRMTPLSRVRYLTSMTHFFKLRCALMESAGL